MAQARIYTMVAKMEKAQEREMKKRDPLYAICRKYNVTLDELKKEQLTKAEHKTIVRIIETVLKYPLHFYPNLQ